MTNRVVPVKLLDDIELIKLEETYVGFPQSYCHLN